MVETPRLAGEEQGRVMWSRETVPVGRAHEARLEGPPGVDSEIWEEDTDGPSGASCARPDWADCDGARDHDPVGKGGQRPHARVGSVPTAYRREQDRAVVGRHQFANPAAGVCAPEESVLGATPVGEGIPCGEHGESDRGDGTEIHCGTRR